MPSIKVKLPGTGTTSTYLHPFTKPSADVILRSTDGVKFNVHKLLLSEASPYFEDMFSSSQPTEDEPIVGGPAAIHDQATEVTQSQSTIANDTYSASGSKLLVVDLTEDANTIEHLLRLIYPITDPVLDSLDEVVAVMAAADKYRMDEALVISQRKLLGFAEREPLRVFAIAYHHKQPEIAKTAARLWLSQPMPVEDVTELSLINAFTFHRLLRYQADARKVVSSWFREFNWIPEGVPLERQEKGAVVRSWDTSTTPCWFLQDDTSHDRYCTWADVKYRDVHPRAWWKDYMDSVAKAIQDHGPSGSHATSETLVNAATRAAMRCTQCGTQNSIRDFQAFTRYLGEAINEKTAEVSTATNVFGTLGIRDRYLPSFCNRFHWTLISKSSCDA
jgi:hypothetical protein